MYLRAAHRSSASRESEGVSQSTLCKIQHLVFQLITLCPQVLILGSELNGFIEVGVSPLFPHLHWQ